MTDTVSIIVPIYKVEAYLSRCVDSILQQTYPHLDIILVDDGSPDRCGDICDDYARKDSRIRVIHKPNGGLSDARNAGIDMATGNYLLFVDSDDWISRDAVEVLLNVLNKFPDADIVAGCSVDVHEGADGKLHESAYSVPLGSQTKLARHDAMEDNLLHGWAAWNKLYRRNLFDHIRFPKGRINEDEAVMSHILALCKYAVKIGHPTYYYFLRQNSITTAAFSQKKMDWLYNCADNLEYISRDFPELYDAAEKRLMSSIIFLSMKMFEDAKRFRTSLKTIHGHLKPHYAHMKRNPYSTAKERILLTICNFVLTTNTFWLYQCLIKAYRKLKRVK